MGSDQMNSEFPDAKQRYAVCISQFERKKAKASYVLQAGDDEIVFIETHLILPEAIAAKLKTLPRSNADHYNVKLTLKDGTILAGQVRNEFEFVALEESEVLADDVVDIALND